jgi:hypothetical protein
MKLGLFVAGWAGLVRDEDQKPRASDPESNKRLWRYPQAGKAAIISNSSQERYF